VRENLLMAARAGVDGRREWTFDRVMETFPRLGERINNGGGSSPAASSRCSPSAAR
jgi:branched-chain amino acid transport system ATP-binding protein